MRVVHLISGLMYGGGQKVALDLLAGFKSARDVDAALWLLGSNQDMLRQHAACVIPYDGRYSSPQTLCRAAVHLRRRLADGDIDVVHSHGWDADAISYLATLGRPERRVIHLHVTPAWIFSRSLKHRARALLTRMMFADEKAQILTVAGAVRDHWSKAFPCAAKAEVIYNSADPTRFHPGQRTAAKPTGVKLGVACRLAKQKGVDGLVRALPDILRSITCEISLIVAGDGPERAALEQLTRALGLEARVRFLGHVDDVETFYRSIDVFVLPSVSDEGMPLAILEAMASGVPIVATDIGGTREVVRNGEEGFVVTPNDQAALSQALIRLCVAPDQRERMGRAACLRVQERFGPRVQIEAIERSYFRNTSARAAQNASAHVTL